MNTLSPWRTFSILTRQAQPWVCRECLRTTRPKTLQSAATFSTSQHIYSQAGKRAWRERIKIPRERRKVAIAATVVFVAGAGALAFSERARYTYMACERSGRVGVTLALCVNDYYWVLRKQEDANFKNLLSACHKRCAERTLEAMEKNGGVFIKLGQHLSSLHYLLPNEWCDTFIPLQDRCPVSSYSSVEAMVKKDTGKSLEDYFTTFEPRPVGAASLAQVHIATLKDTGEKVAVKVQHPTLDDWTKLDMVLTAMTFRTLKYWFPRYDLTWLSDEMETSLPQELDFREEGKNARRMKEYFSRFPHTPLVVPEVVWADRRILVMEYITGHRPDDLAFLDANGISRDEVSAALARIFNEMIFGTDAPLHCDPHGGNLAIRLNPTKRRPRNFDIILYDHGLYRVLDVALQRSYAALWLAVLDADEPRMRRHAKEVANITDEDFPLFASAITGRDYRAVASGVSSTATSDAEKEAIADALGEGMLAQIVQMLGKVPRVILLVLKTNDLTRSLDASLQTTQGPVRSFLILARYAAETVWNEQKEILRRGGRLVSIEALRDWTGYARIVGKLWVFEWVLWIRGKIGRRMEAPDPRKMGRA